MKNLRLSAILTLFAVGLAFAMPALGAQLDTVVFGDSASESAHAMVVNSSGTATGALSQPCRYLAPVLTGTSYNVDGGDITVTMAVDPVRRNYFTLKLWGGDDTDERGGRLYLYVPLNGTAYQIGYRHEGDYAPLSVSAWSQPLPGRFFYSTTLLPLWMTKGKTSLTLKIVSTGELYGLGSGGPPSGNYQYVMDRNSRNIYRAYTHVDPYVDWAGGETQGSAPTSTTLPSPGEEMMLAGGAYYNGVNNRINNRLSTTTSIANFSTADVMYLAHSYLVSGLAGYQNQAVVDKVVALIDAFTTDYYANPTTSVYAGGNEGWGGRFGNLGYAIYYLQSVLTSSTLDALVTYGTNSTTRRAAWGDLLYASREYGRMNRRGLTNQTTIANGSIYGANKGLLVLGDSRAYSETDAQRYIKEACGLLPWLGDDLSGGGSAKPYGSNYYQVTSKGLTREWGYVGAGYGEMAYHVAEWYRLTGNTAFRDQAVKMATARAPFRRPSVVLSGTAYYRTMEVTGLLAWRGAHECDGNFTGYIGYADTATTNEGGKGMLVAAATGDPTLIGYAKQMLADNQFFTYLDNSTGYYNTIEALDSFADYQTVKAAADNGARLPMTDGQPDFAGADEEDRIVALKQGNNRLWITPYWHAQGGTGLNGGTGINGIARFHYSTPSYDQYGVLETTPQFQSNSAFTRPNYMDNPGGNFYVPPDNPTNAYAGEVLPLGITPSDATDSQPFGGKADFYAFRYGRYLIGLNAHASKSYTLRLPVSFTSGTNLMTGAVVSGSAVTVSAASTVVIDTGTAIDVSPVPNAPLLLTAAGNSSPAVVLNWTESSGASTYTVRRSTTQGGPYTDLPEATGITGSTFTDTSVVAGTPYYYVVAASNANGTSYDSMEAATSAGIPSPWADVDIGSVGLAGNATYINQGFVVSGAGSDVGGTADSFNFTYMPVTGDGVLIARLASRSLSGSGGDKIGVMMREDLTAGSKYFALILDKGTVSGASDRLRMSYRSSAGTSASYPADSNSVSLPYWLKVQRAGNVFRCYISSDGSSWSQLGTDMTIAMNSTLNFGLFACSRNTAVLSQGTFDGVSVPGYWGTVPAVPSGLSATAGDASVGLSWPAVGTASSYNVKRSLVSGGPYTVVGTSSSTSFSDSNLTNGTTYYYVVSALNVIGESGNSAEIAVTPQVAPPDTPVGLTDQAGNGFVSLAWNASYGATGYNVKRSISSSGPFTTLTGSPISATSFTDTTVTNGTTYYYVVTAIGVGGEGAATPPVGATPSAVASVPTGLNATSGNGQIALNWAPALGATSYTVRRSTSSGGTYTVIASGVAATSYTDTGVTNGTTYYYTVSAVNAAGESAVSTAISSAPSAGIMPQPWANQDIGSPSIAGGASYSNSTYTVLASGSDIWGTSDQFQFIYQPTAGNCEIYARVVSLTNTDLSAKAGVMIRKSLDPNSAYAFVAVTPTTTNGVRFQYRSTAGGSASEAGSSTGNGKNPPEWLRLVLSGSTVTAYRSNSTSTPSNWISLGSVNMSALTGGFYIGLAVTSHNNSATTTATFTNVTLPTLSTPTAPTNLTASAGKGQVALAWSASSGATSYTIKRSALNGGPYSVLASGVTQTSYTDTGLADGATYYYVVSASNATGEGPNSSPVGATTAPTPTGFIATAGGEQISLSWNALSGATGYTLKRSTVPGGPYSAIATVISGTSYQDINVTSGQSYFYIIEAFNSGVWTTFDSSEKYATPDMPAPWITQDIGSVAITGTGKYTNGVVSTAATGTDIGSSSDSFRIACIPLTGDGTIIARITSENINNTAAKSGLIMRETLAANSAAVIAVRQTNSTARFASRGSTGAIMNYGTDQTGITVPYWFKLARSGSTFTASISTDGTAWTSYGSATVTMNPTIYVGFASVSRSTSNILTSTFDNLAITGWTAPPFTPGGLSATSGNTQVALTWSTSTGATGYNLRRSSVSGGPYALIAPNFSGTSYTDFGLINGTTNYYVVSALGAAGESTDSAQVAGTAMSAQQSWRFTNFGTIANSGSAADGANPAGDGIMNLMKYATGISPLTHSNNPPAAIGTSGTGGGAHLTLAFNRIADPALTYIVEAANDISSGGWSTIWSSTGASNVAGSVIVQDSITLSQQPKRFLRLRVFY